MDAGPTVEEECQSQIVAYEEGSRRVDGICTGSEVGGRCQRRLVKHAAIANQQRSPYGLFSHKSTAIPGLSPKSPALAVRRLVEQISMIYAPPLSVNNAPTSSIKASLGSACLSLKQYSALSLANL